VADVFQFLDTGLICPSIISMANEYMGLQTRPLTSPPSLQLPNVANTKDPFMAELKERIAGERFPPQAEFQTEYNLQNERARYANRIATLPKRALDENSTRGIMKYNNRVRGVKRTIYGNRRNLNEWIEARKTKGGKTRATRKRRGSRR
jgi:hypothetical protein